MMLVLAAIAAFVATFLGGSLALYLKDRLHLILGFSAGAVVAVAFFDLLPEALTVGGHAASTILSVAALGFLVYLVLDRIILLHDHAHEHGESYAVESRGSVRAASLSLHSFLDGLGMGLAFHVSAPVGLVVTLAVIAHDFSDGINTVSVVVRHGGAYRTALRWLFVDALAPIVGVATSFFFALSQSSLALMLALFAGFFIYIGASDLIPESHHEHPKFQTTLMTLLGMVVLYIVIHIAA